MREGRQESVWNCVSMVCYISAVFQSSDPRKIKRDDFNEYKLYKKAQERQAASKEDLDRFAQYFKPNK